MTLVLMAKAFTLNNTIPTNNNQRSLSNPSNMQIAQSGMNMNQDRQMLMVENNVGNQFRSNAVQNVRNQYGDRNVVTTPAEGNGNGINGIQSTQEEFEFMAVVDAYKETERVKASTSGTQSDKAPIYDSDGSAEYTELLEPIPEQHQVPHNDSNVISEVSSVEQGKWIMKKEIRMISKDGKISELPEYTSSKEEEEEDDEEEEEEEENEESEKKGSKEASEMGSNSEPLGYAAIDNEVESDLKSTARSEPKCKEMVDTCESGV
nr:hypothetical protein [Tanacetum cinerariifolium]